MEELSERALLKNLRKEQERERRRTRDRQRRQSMSVEEREKRLARRRRSYQLRRQRASNAPLYHPQFSPTGLSVANGGGEMVVLPYNSDVCDQCNGIASIDSDLWRESLHSGQTNSVGLEVPADKLAKLPRRSRLNHIKRFARSLYVDIGDNHGIAEDLIMKGNATSNCVQLKGLRLNRIKRLARALNCDVTKTSSQGHHTETEGYTSLLCH